VHAVAAPSASPKLLYQAGIGAATNELGMEACSQCDPQRPLSPMVTSDGHLIIIDDANHRWVAVIDRVPITVPLPPDTVTWDALLGPGDVVYVASATVPPGPTSQILAFAADDLTTVLARSTVNSRGLGNLFLDGDELVLQLDTTQRFPLARPAPPTLPQVRRVPSAPSPSVTVTAANGATTTWVLDGSLGIEDVCALPDGSVVVSGFVGTSSTPERAVWRLRPDGAAVAQRVDTKPASFNSGLSLSEHGIISLEFHDDTWQVLQFPLPA
jgi:hypothetical protein